MQKVGIGACCYCDACCCPVLDHVAFATSIWVAVSSSRENCCSLLTGCVTLGECLASLSPVFLICKVLHKPPKSPDEDDAEVTQPVPDKQDAFVFILTQQTEKPRHNSCLKLPKLQLAPLGSHSLCPILCAELCWNSDQPVAMLAEHMIHSLGEAGGPNSGGIPQVTSLGQCWLST